MTTNNTLLYIHTGSNIFQTVSPIKIGTRFKVEVKNETECYIYIFAQTG